MKRRRRRSKKGRVYLFVLVLMVVVGILSKGNLKERLVPVESISSTVETTQDTLVRAADDLSSASASGIPTVLIVVGVCAILLDVFFIHCLLFFRGKKFRKIKRSIDTYIKDCNELNDHIEELRSSYVEIKKRDYGEASYEDLSKYKYKKHAIRELKYAPNIFDCSRTVCDNARKQPFKYICKYFNIDQNEKALEQFESILNNFTAAEEGKELLANKKEEILHSISQEIPWYIKKLFSKKLERELGFENYNFNEMYFPTFSFRYVSAGGNSSTKYDVVLDIEMLERFVAFLAESVKFKNSVAGQRRLMTPKLREYIIGRDNFTCRQCGNSTFDEPNLLLEVDHIVPVSRGGLTTENNLQTLCWKCNRRKGAKIVEPDQIGRVFVGG